MSSAAVSARAGARKDELDSIRIRSSATDKVITGSIINAEGEVWQGGRTLRGSSVIRRIISQGVWVYWFMWHYEWLGVLSLS